jgi:hypothetical protein
VEGNTLSTGFLAALVAEVPTAPSAGPTRLLSTRDSLKVELPIVSANGGLTLDSYQLEIDDGKSGEFLNVT